MEDEEGGFLGQKGILTHSPCLYVYLCTSSSLCDCGCFM